MNSILGASATLVLCATALSQTSWTSPTGYTFLQGNTDVYSSVPFYAANARFQYLDGTQVGTPRANINKIEMRRRPSEVPGTYPARTTTMTVIMAHTSIAAISTTFATNYKGAVSTTVFSGPFSLPDFSAGPNAAPSPFTVAVPLTTFFSYNGTDDLLTEFQCAGTAPSAQQYPLDCVDATAVPDGFGYYNSLEYCTVGSSPFFINYDVDPTWAGTNVTISQYGTGAPANQPGALFIGLGQLYSNYFGSLCANVQPTLDVTIPVMSNALGQIGTGAAPISLTYPSSFVHRVFTQFVTLDPNQSAPLKLALSDDIRWIVGTTGPFNMRRVAATSSSTPPSGLTAGSTSSFYIPIIRFSN